MRKLKEILDRFSEKKIVVIGDVMLDRFIRGKVERISPEAPVPVLEYGSEIVVPGGAANVASNIVSLNGNAALFGFIGKDEAGEELIKILEERGIKFFPIYTEKTTEKIRLTSDDGHQLLRLDKENKSPKKVEHDSFENEIKSADIVVISDYAKGAIDRELMNKLKDSGKKILVDPKPQNSDLYMGTYLIKLNESEALKIASEKDIYEAGRKLKEKFGSKIVITRGAKGMAIFDETTKDIPSEAKAVYDVTGAGDTVLAALALALSSEASLEEAAILANCAAGIAVEKLGTTAVTLSELIKRVFKEEIKIKTREELKDIISEYKKEGKKVVWTNGCFDLLHEGHVRYLTEASKLGDVLVVGINSDASVRALKGPTRPLRPENARAEVLAGLGCVDYVVIFGEANVAETVSYLKPDIYVKASDYDLNKMNQEERKALESYGAKIAFVPIEVSISTTKIEEEIRKRGKE